MEKREVDVLVVGGGTAGLAAYHEVRKAGRRALLVNGGPWGTTCARVGCMPSKLLIAAAEARYHALHADRFGVYTPGGVSVDGRAVMARVQSERDRFVGGVLRNTERIAAEDRWSGWARITGWGEAEVEGRGTVAWSRLVVATGSAPSIPEAFRNLGERLLTTDNVFDLPDLPPSMAVIGTGVIGLELGQAFQRLGVEVLFLDMAPHLQVAKDVAIRGRVEEVLGEELDLQLGASALHAERSAEGVLLRWTDAEGRVRTRGVHSVLVATGRHALLDGLGLERLGVEVPARGPLPVHPETMQWGEHPVFVAGDANRDRPLLHEASDEGHIAGRNAARWPEVEPVRRRTPLTLVFTDPQLALVGPPACDLDPENTVYGEVDWRDQGRARVMARNEGLARIYADRRTRRVVAAQIFGPSAEHLGHLMAWALETEETVDTLLTRPFYHPVLEEGLRTALRALAKTLETPTTNARPTFDCPRPGG